MPNPYIDISNDFKRVSNEFNRLSIEPPSILIWKHLSHYFKELSITAAGITPIGVPNLQQVTDIGAITTNAINTGGITTDYVQLDTTATPTLQPGMFAWNDADGTADLRLKGGNVTLQLGQETVVRVVNKTGSNLLESQYKVVRVRIASEGGAQGQRLAVVLAQGDNDPDSVTTLGIVTENINVNQEGFITVFGNVNGINTTGSLQGETWVDGDVLYLSPTTPGALTNVKPVAPNHTVTMGYVVYAHNNQGKIFVKVDNGYELDELHNVLITSPVSNQLLRYNGTVWQNWTPNFLTSVPTLAQVTTAGNTTTNAIIINGNTITPNGSGHKVVLSANSDAITRMYFDSTATGANWNAGMSISASSVPKWTIAGYGSTYDFTFYNEGLNLPGLFIKGSNNNVIIGASTWNPTDAGYKLDVNGTARVSGNLTVDTNTLFVDAANNKVGIGIASPARELSVAGNVLIGAVDNYGNTHTKLYIHSPNNSVNFVLNPRPTATDLFYRVQIGVDVNSNGSFYVEHEGAGRIIEAWNSGTYLNLTSVVTLGNKAWTLQTNGYGLQMYSPFGWSSVVRYTNASTGTTATDGALTGITENGDFRVWTYESHPMLFATANAERMRITNTGDVGIGTLTPNAKLDVQGVVSASMGFKANNQQGINGDITVGGQTFHFEMGILTTIT